MRENRYNPGVMPLQKDLQDSFDLLLQSQYQGIPGVLKIDSGTPGPTLGVTIFTHGNEPSGLAVFDYFQKDDRLKHMLLKGSVIFAIANMRAAQKYMEAQSYDEERKARYEDLNFNRLPEDALTTDRDDYEISRLQELYPVLQEFDYGFDVHSTEQETKPMLVMGGTSFDLLHNVPIDIVITNIEQVQIGIAFFSFFGGLERDIPVIGVESGSHKNPQSFKTAQQALIAYMQNIGLVKNEGVPDTRLYTRYHVVESLLFPDESYKLQKELKMFEAIKAGQVIGVGDGSDIVSPMDGHALMAPKGLIPSCYKEEVIFISKAKEIIEV